MASSEGPSRQEPAGKGGRQRWVPRIRRESGRLVVTAAFGPRFDFPSMFYVVGNVGSLERRLCGVAVDFWNGFLDRLTVRKEPSWITSRVFVSRERVMRAFLFVSICSFRFAHRNLSFGLRKFAQLFFSFFRL